MVEDGILQLKGPDRVRLRPGIFFDSDGIDGVIQAVKVVFDIFFTKAMLGHSKRIDITVHNDNSVSIYSPDRGLIIDENIYEGLPGWYYDFCELYVKPKKQVEDTDYIYLTSFNRRMNLYGKTERLISKYPLDDDSNLEISFTQYVSEYMNVVSIRDGIKKTLFFRKGYSVSKLKKETTSDESSTFIHFKPDPDVFNDTNLPLNRIRNIIRGRAVRIEGVEFRLSDERSGVNETYFYPEGIEGYAKSMVSLAIPLFVKEIEATGRDRYNRKEYDARLKLYFGFSTENAQIGCFHNYRVLRKGGEHLTKLKERVGVSLSLEFGADFVKKSNLSPEELYEARKKAAFSFEELSNCIVLILESNCSDFASCWTDVTRAALINRMMTDMACDLVGEEFDKYLRLNHKKILNVLKEIEALRCDD